MLAEIDNKLHYDSKDYELDEPGRTDELALHPVIVRLTDAVKF